MNFLAHIYLSGTNEQLMIGNFIADFVKGKKKDDYADDIRKGIELHRFIDHFTDHHEVVLNSIRRIHDSQEKYSGVVVDILYDHFLAANFSSYSAIPLQDFSQKTYSVLQSNLNTLPEGVHYFLPFMIERNWLLNYATIDGIGRALAGLSKRVKYENKMHEAVLDLKAHYHDLESDFRIFFPELMKAVTERMTL
ncbi:MAG: acyl carrier protein phosphodiesterase [Bacteroidetes bacterium]|nr:acyl carrier protein phosphodiesterase [Bacteroidota bacterium]